MDEIDKTLVELLQKNARMQLKQLAPHVFLSPPAVAARIEKLEQSGIITGYHASVNPEKLGYPIMAFIELTMDPEMKSEFMDFIQGAKNVTECYHVAGAYSMLIKAVYPTPTELNSFVGSLQRFGKTQTQIVFSTVVAPREII